MIRVFPSLALASIALASACGRAESPVLASQEPPALTRSAQPSAGSASLEGASGETSHDDAKRAERKIVRSADLEITVADVGDAESRLGVIAEQFGGVVASSDVSHPLGAEDLPVVRMTLRIPAEHFRTSIERCRSLASRVVREVTTTNDVTETFIDVEARLASQKALEAQFLEILKQARTVKDALDVNVQLAEVRANIERFEAQKKTLTNQTSFATIQLAVSPAVPVVDVGSFAVGDTLRRARVDLVNVSAGIVRGSIRAVGVGVPVVLLVVLPMLLLLQLVRRYLRRPSAASNGSRHAV